MVFLCLLPLVFNAPEGQVMERHSVACVAETVAPVWPEGGINYRHVKVDCTEGLKNLRDIAEENFKIWWSHTDVCHKI
jgi:hypothetical protein